MGFAAFYNSTWNIEYILQILIAEAMCCVCFKRKKHFEVRAVISVILSIVLYMLLRQFDEVLDAHNAPRILYSIKFYIVYFMTIGAIKFCFDETIWSVLFAASAAQLMQHFAFEIASLLVSLCNIPWNAAGAKYASANTTNTASAARCFFDALKMVCMLLNYE